MVLRFDSPETLQAFAERLGRELEPGDVLALSGPLGAGKTTFSQGLARGLGVPPERHVSSPTFALLSEHPGRVNFVHGDFYRIETPAELEELGLDDAFDTSVVAIEWADRFPDVLPSDRLTVTLGPLPDGTDGRELHLSGTGPRARELVERLGA